jgi:membrane protease YdiL (CAAX protease family)
VSETTPELLIEAQPTDASAAPTSAETPPTLRERLVAVAEIGLCSSLPTQLVIGNLLWAVGLAEGGLSLTFVATLTMTDTVVIIWLMVMLTRARGERVKDLWLGRQPFWSEFGHGLLLVPVALGMVLGILLTVRALAPWLHNVEVNPLERLADGGPLNAALFALVAIVGGGVREELQRAFVLQRFERYLGGPMVGLVIWSILFGVLHVDQGFDAVVTTGLLGAFWGMVYLRRRSVVAPIISHSGFNSLEILRVAVSAAAGR